jgi:hypothetical protein
MALQAAVNLNLGSQTLSLANALSGVVIKLNTSANYLYYRTFNAPFLDIRALDVKNDLLVIGGNYTGTLTCSTSGFPAITGDYDNRIFGISMHTDGTYISHFEESSTSNISLNDLAINNIGKIWVTGNFNCTFGSISDDLGEGLFNNIGYKDVFLAYYATDSNNTRTFAQMLGSKGEDDVFSVFADNERYPILAGSFSYNLLVKRINNCTNCGNSMGNYTSYCGYNDYSGINYKTAIGSKDIFCTTAIDTTSNVLDIYNRSGAGCELVIKDPYIYPNQDTLYLCNPRDLSVQHNIANLPYLNEILGYSYFYYNRQWKRNGSVISNSNIVSANTSAQYTVKMSTADNCRIYNDTIQVVMLQNIDNPGIWVEGANLYDVIGSPSGCRLNIPTAYQQSITVHGQTFNSSDSLTWTHTSVNPTEITAIDSSQVSLNEAGTYNYEIQTESGCIGSTCFSVWQYIFLSTAVKL